jgi:hypothetical protein
MLESIFFITLGICCVLLMMLIYHFKQRLTKVEQSNDTMFEILNNMVHELSDLKRSYSFGAMQSQPSQMEDNRIVVSLDDDDDESQDDSSLPDLIPNRPGVPSMFHQGLSDDDTYSSDNGSESGSDSDSDEDDNEDGESDGIKLVDINIDNSLDIIDITDELSEYSNVEDELVAVEINTDQVDLIQIHKVDNAENLEETTQNNEPAVNSREVYKKMNVPSLKALVIEKGLITDPGKLKKLDLLDLLESA